MQLLLHGYVELATGHGECKIIRKVIRCIARCAHEATAKTKTTSCWTWRNNILGHCADHVKQQLDVHDFAPIYCVSSAALARRSITGQFETTIAMRLKTT